MTNHPLCAVDQRPVHDGGRLCGACRHDLERDLAELAEDLLHDLDRVLARLTRTGGSPIGIVVRAERGLTFDERAGDLLRELHNTLGGWVRVIFEDNFQTSDLVCSLCLVEQRNHAEGPADRPRYWYVLNAPMVRDDAADFARWLREHQREIRRHEAAGELWREVRDLVERARDLVDQHRSGRVYIGVCSQAVDENFCDADLYVHDGRATAICKACGTEHDIAERRAVMLDAMGGEKLTAAELSRAFATYGGYELKVERIRKWHQRGRIYQHPPRDGERWPRYRVAVVRRLLDRELVRQAS